MTSTVNGLPGVSGARSSKRIALADLYDNFGSTAYSLALSITRDSESAERIVATAFARAWSDFDQELAATSTFFLQLMTTVRDSAVAYRSSPSRAADFAITAPGSDSVQQAVAVALRDLGAAQQQILALAYFGGLAISEIAAHLQQPLAVVRAALQSALTHVREKIRQQPTVSV